MWLRDLHRTSGFHIALLFFATFGTASLGLFGFLYLETRNYGRSAAYEWVVWESSRLNRLSAAELSERSEAWEDFEQGGRPLVIFDANGNRIAGADIPFPRDAPVGQPFERKQALNGKKDDFYNLLSRLPDGNLLLVGRSAKVLEALETALIDTFFWGIAGTIGIGLAGAIVFGFGSLRQIEEITTSAEQIMQGDLSGRLPTHGLSADLGHLTSVVNGMLEQLERLMTEVKGVNENIAHDLRTPLTRVMASLQRSLRNAETTDEFRAVNEDAVAEIRQIVARFSALLRISELEDRVRRSGFSEVDLAQIADDVVAYFEPVAAEKSIALGWHLPAASATVDGDASLLFEAMSNLVDNALKFTPAGGSVTVAVSVDPAGVTVSDTGCGIAPDERDHVVRRFQRSVGAGRVAGFGIGLSLVQSIARLHNMELSLHPNDPGCRAELRSSAT